MHKQRILTIILTSLLVPACAITGPADDGFENSHESLDTGRIFGGNDGYTLYKSQRKPAAANNSVTESDAVELNYQAYQQWRKARQSNSPEYQKFELWQEFEAFQQWREQQKN